MGILVIKTKRINTAAFGKHDNDALQTAAIKEASLKCKQKQDQLDQQNKEVKLFGF